MKNAYIATVFTFFVFVAYGQNKDNPSLYIPAMSNEIIMLDSTINLYKAGNFFISGQPNDSVFSSLKNIGLGLVINIRTPEEMEAMKITGLDEEQLLDSLNIPYVNVPIGGNAGFTKEAIENINSAINANSGDIMIHCRSAGRATNAWVAWLINYQHVPVDEAIALGKKMELRFYLEDLLGYELFFDKKN